ncbi:hypothetical protein GCM10027047_08390 [Rhodococcus aerolatus]
MSGAAASPDGSVRVVTDAGGVPEQVVLDSAALRSGEQQLAAELLALCRQAGARARAELATALDRAGLDARAATTLGLDAPVESSADATAAEQPESWLRPW